MSKSPQQYEIYNDNHMMQVQWTNESNTGIKQHAFFISNAFFQLSLRVA